MDGLTKDVSKLKVKDKKDVQKTRRRLSLVAGAEGAADTNIDGIASGKPEEESIASSSVGGKAFKSWAQLSRVGYVPFNQGKVNQDRPFIVTPFQDDDSKALFGVFDGHGSLGHEVSQWVIENLGKIVSKQANLDTQTEAALSKAFVDCNTTLKRNVDCTFSGTTAVMTYLRGSTLYCANAGDSRATMARRDKSGKLVAYDLSTDQKPERADECKRIIDSGGRVACCKGSKNEDIGPARVWLKEDDVPGLAMTRSFGDNVAASVGVTAKPEVSKTELTAADEFMVIASDGVWEFITSQEAIDIVAKCDNGNDACKALYRESLARWQKEEEVVDDTTAVVIYFKDLVKK